MYPTLKGDYEGTLGLSDYWANDDEKNNDKLVAEIIVVIFAFLVIQLFLAIIFTINTDPGGVPQDREFDLPDDDVVAALGSTKAGRRKGMQSISKSTSSNHNTASSVGSGIEHEKLLNDDII